jgi:hypothetical protein
LNGKERRSKRLERVKKQTNKKKAGYLPGLILTVEEGRCEEGEKEESTLWAECKGDRGRWGGSGWWGWSCSWWWWVWWWWAWWAWWPTSRPRSWREVVWPSPAPSMSILNMEEQLLGLQGSFH